MENVINIITILIVLAVILVGFIVVLYNGLIAKRNQVKSIEAGVDTQLKRRYDLLTNLVATEKAYMAHESELLQKIVSLREKAQMTHSSAEKFALNNQLSSALNGLRIQIENYPDLKSNQNILHVQQALTEIEEQISAARRAYNSAVEIYNNAVEMFPSNMVANFFGFKQGSFFDIPENEAEAPNMQNLFNNK